MSISTRSATSLVLNNVTVTGTVHNLQHAHDKYTLTCKPQQSARGVQKSQTIYAGSATNLKCMLKNYHCLAPSNSTTFLVSYGFNVSFNTLCHFGDDLSSHHLTGVKKPDLSNELLGSYYKPNLTATKLQHKRT